MPPCQWRSAVIKRFPRLDLEKQVIVWPRILEGRRYVFLTQL